MTLKERFLQWKRSVLPESASGTITNIFSNYSMWEAAKSELNRLRRVLLLFRSFRRHRWSRTGKSD